MGVEILGTQGRCSVPNVNILENLTFLHRFHWLYASDSNAFLHLRLVPHVRQFSYSSLLPLTVKEPHHHLTREISLVGRASSWGSSIPMSSGSASAS